MVKAETIDDIFDQIEHYRSRGSTIVVTHPIIGDMTEKVINERCILGFGADVPEGTRYFGLFDPDIPDATYIQVSSRASLHKAQSENAEIDGILEYLRSPFDKVAQRQLCSELGIFKNPRYLDVRKMFTDSYARARFRFVPEEFTEFPIDEIVSGLGQMPRSYIFHNMVDGFRIRNSKRGGYTISGRSNLVKEADAETKSIKDPRQRLERFLEKLTEKGFVLEAVGLKGNTNSQQDDLIRRILSHKGNLYIKDARTGGGYLVVRVRNEGQETYVESDSPDFACLVKQREEKLKDRRARYDRMKNVGFSQSFIDELQKSAGEFDPKDPNGILYDLFSILENPIIEEEIPYETFNGQRAEFRLICQRVPKTRSEDESFEIEGYVKVSSNGVSANISLGGHGEPVKEVLKGMYRQRMPAISERELSSIAAEAERDVITRTKDFAEKAYFHYASILTLRGNDTGNQGTQEILGISKAPRDFAVDLIPRWDDETGKIDYCFLEINYSYGYEGLQKADMPAALRVYKNKALIRENK